MYSCIIDPSSEHDVEHTLNKYKNIANSKFK